jgi:hypothetical protein
MHALSTLLHIPSSSLDVGLMSQCVLRLPSPASQPIHGCDHHFFLGVETRKLVVSTLIDRDMHTAHQLAVVAPPRSAHLTHVVKWSTGLWYSNTA